MLSVDDTIAAVASAPGGAARGIVRLSGPKSLEVIRQCFQATCGSLDWAVAKTPLVVAGQWCCFLASDNTPGSPPANQPPPLTIPAEVLLWPTARSYTRQPLAEIHTFGSPPLLKAVLQSVCAAGARPATGGEFTLRAFLGGRIDLIEAEGVLGVIDAADRRQLEAALEQLAGGLSRPLKQLRGNLLDLLADLEAGLDFVEDDIRFVEPAELAHRLAALETQLQRLAGQLSARGFTAGLPRVVLLGPPNAGKSSLFNALAPEVAALVSPQPGTTRDYLMALVEFDGLPIELVDTAGVETNPSASDNALSGIDAAAQSLAIDQHRRADLRLLCCEATCLASDRLPEELFSKDRLVNSIVVLTKCDLLNHDGACRSGSKSVAIDADASPVLTIETSSRTGLGLDRLRTAVREQLSATRTGAAASGVVGTAVRIRENIAVAIGAISAARELTMQRAGDELVAAEIRAALHELGQVVGTVYTDDLLDRIFSRFCIGK